MQKLSIRLHPDHDLIRSLILTAFLPVCVIEDLRVLRQRIRKKKLCIPGNLLKRRIQFLCLVTFATLSLSSAKRDQRYSQQLAGRETAYCEANAKAAQIMAQIDDAFAKEDPVFAIRQIEGVTAEEDGANLDISYVVPVTDSQNLEVEILADPVKGTQKVVKWKESASEKWEEKSTLPVLGSD